MTGTTADGRLCPGNRVRARHRATSTDRITRRRRPRAAGRSSPGRYRLVVSRACPWASRAVIVRRLLGLEDALPMGICRPDPRRAQLDLRPRPGRPRPGARHRAAAGGLLRARSRATTGASPCRRSSTCRPAQVVTNDFAQITLDLSTRVARPTTGTARPTSTPSALRDEIDEVMRAWSTATSTTASTGRVRRRRRRPTTRRTTGCSTGWTGSSDRLAEPPLPRRRHHHRGRRPAVHHAGALRRRLPRPLQVQPAEAHRDAGALGLRARPVPDARLRRHGRLRPHQAALLRGAPRHQPDAVVPLGPDLAGWPTPHDREQLGGRPFGDGTPPGPVARAEQVPAAHNPALPGAA